MIARFFLVPVLFFSLLTPVRAEWPQCGTVNAWPGAEWPQADPGRWNRDLLRQARALSRSQDAGAAVMVVYRGHLVARWGDIAEPRLVQSVRKQLLSSLVGLEVKAGRLHLDDTLADLGVNDTRPPLTPAERKATLRDLLESRSGIFHSAHYEVGGWRRLREKLRRQEEESGKADAIPPGKLWIYNNWDFNTVGDIVEQSADRPIGPYFRQAIADPLGMQDFRADDVEYTGDGSLSAWMLGNHSIHPAYAFRISARDLARYGVLWLGCGQWNGQQVLPASWVLESTRGRDTLDGADPNGIQKDFGYFGYLWWV
ncbi:MAG: serine hydrolase, partial [Gammaproteobacteria bacterium]